MKSCCFHFCMCPGATASVHAPPLHRLPAPLSLPNRRSAEYVSRVHPCSPLGPDRASTSSQEPQSLEGLQGPPRPVPHPPPLTSPSLCPPQLPRVGGSPSPSLAGCAPAPGAAPSAGMLGPRCPLGQYPLCPCGPCTLGSTHLSPTFPALLSLYFFPQSHHHLLVNSTIHLYKDALWSLSIIPYYTVKRHDVGIFVSFLHFIWRKCLT